MAQTIAGNQPSRVICKSKAKKPENIFPLFKKENAGTNISVRDIFLVFYDFLGNIDARYSNSTYIQD